MSMVINLVEDHNIYLCEGGPVYNGGIQPAPITYLTQWKIVGNSEVHTLPYPDGIVLPNGYKRCKYLEFHGTEYIDSGVLTKNDIGFRCQYSSTEANKSMFGAQSPSGNLFLFSLFTTNTAKTGYGGSSTTANINTNPIDGNRHTLILDSEQCKIDNESVGVIRRTASLFYNVFIGTHNVGGNADSRKFIGKIYEFKLYDSNGNLFNGIPCLDDNNIPCLYDTVSRTAFYNIGTGTFGYEIEPQPTEIWSCGEYNPTDGKYHILVKPQGGNVVDIVLNAPLKKVNDVAETIVYPHPSGVPNAAIVSVFFTSFSIDKFEVWKIVQDRKSGLYSCLTTFVCTNGVSYSGSTLPNFLCNKIETVLSANDGYVYDGECIFVTSGRRIIVRNPAIEPTVEAYQSYFDSLGTIEIIYPLKTPGYGGIKVSQIEEAESYSCVISQEGKAVSWSEFITDRESLYAYGVQWDKEVANPNVTRIGNMELHKASKLPVQNAMRGCLLNDNGEVVQYLSDSDWQNASLLDGSHGQVMIEIPDFYWKFSEDANGIQSVMLSMVEIEGYKKVNKMYVSAYQAALDRTNLKLASVKNNTAQYRGGNNTSRWDEDSQKTLLGRPVTNVSLTNFRTYARNRKANSTEWNCNTYLIQKVLYWLFVVEFATRNTQEAIDSTLTTEGYHKGGLGSGVTNVNDATWNSYNSRNPFIACGYTDSLGNGTGQVSLTMPLGANGANVTIQVPRYRGIENPFGHIWEWTDGIHVKVQSETDGGESQVYVSYDPATWNDDNYTGYTYIGNEDRTNDTWIKEVLFGNNGDIFCKAEGGSSSQYFTDKHSTSLPTSGSVLRAVRFGGLSSSVSGAGLVCSNSSTGHATAFTTFGSRLCFLPASEQTEA